MLTEKKIKDAEVKDKRYKMADSGGLYIRVHPGGYKYWYYTYWKDKKHQTISIGTWPQVGLAQARRIRDEARKNLLIAKQLRAQERLRKSIAKLKL